MVLTLFYVALAISAVILLTVGFLVARTTRRTRTQADEIRDDAFDLIDEVNAVLSKDSVLAGLIRAGHGPRVESVLFRMRYVLARESETVGRENSLSESEIEELRRDVNEARSEWFDLYDTAYLRGLVPMRVVDSQS